MKRLLLLVIGCLLLAAGVCLAQPGGAALEVSSQSYQVTWYTFDGGGLTFSAGGGRTLGGTAGQPDAGAMSGGGYTLAGGFWYRVPAGLEGNFLYLPLVMRGS
jgi:hypothetical protein